jgi:hypothetical protein
MPRPSTEPVKLGQDFQADVPPLTSVVAWDTQSEEDRLIVSELVYSPRDVGGLPAVESFLAAVNADLVRRDGFPLSPMNEERALALFAKRHGDPNYADDARKDVLRSVQRTVEYPGAGMPWSNEEQCLLARTLSERHRDFEYISRNILPERSTKELVVHYYTRYKQLWQQFGGRKQGMMFDRGLEIPLRISMSPEAQVQCLRSLASTAGDGFPPERRMRDAIFAARAAKIRSAARVRTSTVRERDERRVADFLGN